MAATIHRDPYRILIRKIGYSVGLEHTLERVRDLVDLYSSDLSVTSASIGELIHKRWNLKTNNILDLFNELDLTRSEANTIFVLPTLDALAILRLKLEPRDFEEGLRSVLLYSLLTSDGDILLNCLAAKFEKENVRAMLIAMVEEKRRKTKEVVRAPQIAKKIDRFITIETQKSNKGGSAAGQGINALQRRESLEVKRGPLATEQSSVVEVSEDYLRKVPGRRRDWALTLDLIDNDRRLTIAGERLLKLFRRLNQQGGSAFTFWPYSDELPQLNLKQEYLPWTTPHRKDVVHGLKTVMTGFDFGTASCSNDQTIEWLNEIFKVYRDLNPRRSLVRVELPLRVAQLAALGYACASTPQDHDILSTVKSAQESKQNIELRSSRQHEGSIVFRRNR